MVQQGLLDNTAELLDVREKRKRDQGHLDLRPQCWCRLAN